MVMPSPDWDMVTLKWAGTYLDGTPCNGSLTINYNGGVLLDDNVETPVNIYPAALTVPIVPMQMQIDGKTQQVGYAEVQVPASNDPDIQGSGGTYSLTESLFKGGGRQNASFVADINAPGGVIWLNRIIPTTPVPGQPLSVVYYSDFTALRDRVDALAVPVVVTKASIGLGNVDNTSDLNKPVSTATQTALNGKAATTHTHTKADVGLGNVDNTSDANKPVSTATAAALASNATADRSRANHTGTQLASTISDFTEAAQDAAAAAIIAGSGITKTYDDAANTVTIATIPGVTAVTVDNIPAGSMLAVRKSGTTWPARPTSRTDVVVSWIGADPSPAIVASGTGGMLDNIDIRFVTP